MPATDENMAPLIALIGVCVYLLVLLVWQWRAGVLSPRAFTHSPRRAGTLGMHDGFIAVGLWLVGSSLGATLAATILGESKAPDVLLMRGLSAYAGALPALGYILVRAGSFMDRGLTGFGLGVHRPLQTLVHTFNVALFIIPATMLTMAVARWIGQQLGHEVPAIAHDYLQAILDADSSAVRYGLIGMSIFIAPLYEEFIFRGMLQTSLLQGGVPNRRWTVILLASLLFMLIHLGLPVETLPGLFVLGVGLGYLYERTGSLWPPIIVHVLFNAANVVLAISGVVSE